VAGLFYEKIMIQSEGCFPSTIQYKYTGYEELVSIKPVFPQVKITTVSKLNPLSRAELTRSRLDVIKQRGSLRVGYLPRRLPFVYTNKYAKIVGFDMELMHVLARDLGVKMEVTKMILDKGEPHLVDWLNSGRIDILIWGIGITPPRALRHQFTRAYLDGNLVLIVKDHQRQDFSTLKQIRKMSKLKLAMPDKEYFKDILKKGLPNVEIIEIHSIHNFLRGEMDDVDAYVLLAEAASARTLIYPGHSVVVPTNLGLKTPIGFSLPDKQHHFTNRMNDWIDLRIKSNTIDKIYQHWIFGKSKQAKKSRWPIKRDVLGWGGD